MDPNLAELLRECAEAGIKVEFYAMDDACPVCAVLAGRLFEPRQAQTVPVPDCQGDGCRCDYLPAP